MIRRRLAKLVMVVALGAVVAADAADHPGTLGLEGIAPALYDAEKRAVRATTAAILDGRTHGIGFQTLLRSGDRAGEGVFGQLVDEKGRPIRGADGRPRISNDNDFSSLLRVGDGLFMVSHFESRPGAMYLTELGQDRATGRLTPLRTRPIDFSGVRGGWVHCAGSVTPWGTHLGSEEYEPYADGWNAKALDPYYAPMADYFGGDPGALNPYDYGWQIELRVAGWDAVTVAKHYAMGRLSHELGSVMPDRRTVYITDDGTNVALYRFVADRPEDLSAGTLYMARWHQTGVDNGGSADLTWVDLGHATDAEIRATIDRGIRFADLFEQATPTGDGACPDGFGSINAGHDEGRPLHQCLKLRPGMEKLASRLESRRFGALRGGTTEFRKMEGITHDPDRKRLYLSLSEIDKGMEDGRNHGEADDRFDRGGPNHVRVPFNRCGGVYALDLDAGYVARTMRGLVTGRMTRGYDKDSPLPAYDKDGPFAKNKCDLDGIANPDNLTYLRGRGILVIGEDSGGGHQNDMVWAYRLDDGALSRILSTPYGSEATSPYFYPNIDGWAYLMSVVQHPYGESDRDQMRDGDEARAYTGYIGPFPAME